ncbi:hypothetical protein [Shewanella waksmanii]|uniref:hypothetical protein n=1 Tax=Shewanella waksmanii TaxID=213783 RepID=UPI003734F116
MQSTKETATQSKSTKDNNKAQHISNHSWLHDLYAMDTGLALLHSMTQSKTLMIMVIAGVLLFGGFMGGLFLMAP